MLKGMAEQENSKIGCENGDDDEEEEIEPKFKYHRIANDLKTIINKEVVNCCAVHPKFLIFGTFLGRVYLLDHQGNSIESNLNNNQHQFAHSVAVNHIDIDEKGEYVATCSDDGKVNITGLFSDDNNQNINFQKSIKAVALEPESKSTSDKRFIVGDKNLTLYERNFLKKTKTTCLAEAEGSVLSVCWNGRFVAWASYLGVRVHSLSENCSLGLMKWEEPINARLENFRCNFRWSNDTTLLIGWVDTIRICVIRKRNSVEASSRDLPGHIVDPISTFQTSFYICGLAPLTANQLVVLGYPKEKDEDRKALRPVLCVMDYKLNSSEEICTDSLSLRGYQEYNVNDYSLGCIIEENRYIIVAPKDIVVASLYDTDDRVKWLVENRKFEEALEVISMHGGSTKSLTVARLYINYLLEKGHYDEAAKICLNALGNNKSLWEEEIYKFVNCNQLRSVSPYLPTSDACKLKPQVYEIVLFEFLKYNIPGFLNLIKIWPAHLYDSQAVINAIRDNFSQQNELLESLAILYSHIHDYENALRMYLELKNKDVFKLIRCHELYNVIDKIIIPLINLDSECAFQILLDKRKISPDLVVQHLEQHQEYLYLYLNALDKVDSSGKFHSKLVKLYATFSPDKLLPFLRRSKHYDIQEAYKYLCERQSFYAEEVYLLGQLGNTEHALNIIIDKLKDINMAIEFCKEHDDSDLWNLLIDESVKNPQILTKLLDGIVGYVNPEALVNKIKLGQQIPGLRQSVIKMLWDYRLQVKIQENVHKIQQGDYFKQHNTVVRQQQRGIGIYYDQHCEKCNNILIHKNSKYLTSTDIIAFNCGHVYHEACVPDGVIGKYCALCRIFEEEDTELNSIC